MTDAQWDNVIDVNLRGAFYTTREVIPYMYKQEKGSIINISSIVGEYGNIGQTNYAATKAGLIGLTYTWAKEFTRKGAEIRTNAIAPGYADTEMMQSVPEKILKHIIDTNPMHRLAKPEEIANAALFLASNEASFVNGHVFGSEWRGTIIMTEFIPASQVGTKIKDGATIVIEGFIGSGVAEAIHIALSDYYRQHHHPNQLTLIHAAGIGDGKTKGMNRYAQPGMVKTVDWWSLGHGTPIT